MFDFSKVVDRHGTWCTQWDYVADRFGTADLLPFTISDMDFATAPCIIEALNQRLMHGVFGYSRWKNDEFLAAIAHWFSTQHYTAIDPQSVVYGPSVIYMVSELIRQWSETGEGVVIHTPAYDAFYKAIEGNQRTVIPVALEKQADGWFCDMGKLEAVLAKPECKIMLLCSPQNPTGKVWTCDELEIMADLCERHGVRVISDEIHMDMVWGEQPHIPWCNVARG
ncbi:aminotransferase class I/II-fold pyridoxal phosphate-dependent enzyme, partial [Escherichia coli]